MDHHIITVLARALLADLRVQVAGRPHPAALQQCYEDWERSGDGTGYRLEVTVSVVPER